MPRRFLPWAIAVGLVWSVGGLHVDGWAHTHGHADSGPFTPWHALVYSGTLFILCSLLSAFRADIRHGATWRTALDPGFRLALVGAIGFGVAGVCDITWHLIFGVENSFSALMSPTHFMLNASICTIAGGALASSWMSGRRLAAWSDVVTASMLLSIFTFWSLFDDLFTNRYATGSGPDEVLGADPTLIMELGVFSVLYRSAVLAGVVLLLVRRFELPRGALTLMIGLNGVLLLFMVAPGNHSFVIPVLAGVLADVLYAVLRPSLTRRLQLRFFAFGVPFIFWAIFFVERRARGGIWWPVHVWTGAIVMAGGVGLVISFVVLPLLVPAQTAVPAPPDA
jgi:hypothetical protein